VNNDDFITNAVNPRLASGFQSLKTAYNTGNNWPADAGAALNTFDSQIKSRLASSQINSDSSGPALSLLNATRAKISTALAQAITAMDVSSAK
jgi:hypothetical protein